MRPRSIVPTPGSDAAELDALLDACGWNGADLAARVGVDRSLVHRWRNGIRPVPERVMTAMRASAAAVASVWGE